jgi:hypothetical protein
VLKTISLIIAISISNHAYSSCFIEDVVDLFDAEYSRNEIREECDGQVEESDCSLSKIIKYARDGKGLSSILRRCEIRDNDSNGSYRRDQYEVPTQVPARICATPYGNCPMAVPIPQGSSCYCPSSYGAVWGIGR